MRERRAPVMVVTGPTGAGKSTVCRWLASLGAWWIDADRVAHELLEAPVIHDGLVQRFGDQCLDGKGHIDRRALGALVFADPRRLEELNALVHPPLVAELRRRIEVLRPARSTELIVVDAALHFQMQPRLEADLVVGVTAPATLREERVARRDGIDAEAVRHRMDRQRAVEASLSQADALLDSSIAAQELRDRVLGLVDERLGTGFAARARRVHTWNSGVGAVDPSAGEAS